MKLYDIGQCMYENEHNDGYEYPAKENSCSGVITVTAVFGPV